MEKVGPVDTVNQNLDEERPPRREVLDLSWKQARSLFLKQESYCTIEFPTYIVFGNLISGVHDVLKDTALSDHWDRSPREYDDVNHVVMHSKDGRYAWRALELIHPALYVALVNTITEPFYWGEIQQRFREFNANDKIDCLSIPVEALKGNKDRAEQIKQWWLSIEQKSIELALEYEFLIHTDIVDCYPEIYTHSIAWALHTKKVAKAERNNKRLIGNLIDRHIQDMRNGQTNGIPQGSVLMDFIAEIVLGYADTELMGRIDSLGIKDYKILRYRDDYRIFVNNPQAGERVLKCLTEVMIDLGMKLSPQKTEVSSDVILASIKTDKLKWAYRKQSDNTLQKHLLIIHDHSTRYPNSGSLPLAMQKFSSRLDKVDRCDSPLPLISIVVDIACRNPRVYPVAAALLSRLIGFIECDVEKCDVIARVRRKFGRLPNTEHMQTWLQRISYPFDPFIDFDTPICRLVLEDDVDVWNSTWITSPDLRAAVKAQLIVDREALADVPAIVRDDEFALFSLAYP